MWKLNLISLDISQQVSAALVQLPAKEFVRLPLFAYQITGNPHAFDENGNGGHLFLQMLSALSQPKEQTFDRLEKIEQRHGLLAEFNLLKDDIMNYAAIRGLRAFDSQNQENPMWQQACRAKVSWNVPLKEILRMGTICSYQNDKVLVVENSGVYSILLELLPDVSIVCSSGQFTFAIWQLLRKLVRTDTQLYYCGDLDPEGLAMAQRLKSAFGDQIQWICMNLNHFNLAKTTTKLSENRFKQLRMITDPALSKIAEAIQVEEKVAYQEGFLSHLIDEVEWLFWHDQR